MATEIGNFGFHPFSNSHLHPYLMIEKDVGVQCDMEKERLKSELIATVKNLANENCYSLIDAKIAATSLIDEKLDEIINRMKENTTDVVRREVIENTWQTISGELYSPFEFKGTLEAILKRERTD